MKKAIFIYNPLSGNRSVPKKLDHIVSRFEANNTIVQPYRLFKDNCIELADLLKSGGFDYAVLSGGDGTLNSIASIILKNNINIPIGIIPSGTCNDFARDVGIPSRLDSCLDIIFAGKTIEVDVGLLNEKEYFFSTCAGGLFVMSSLTTHSELKKNFGPIAYYLKGLSEMTNIKPFSLKITTEKEKIKEDVLLFLILNGRHGAGFTNIIKEADISDGIMDIIIVKSCSHIELVSMFFKVLGNDSLVDKNVIRLRTKTCNIEGSSDIILSIDGEKGSPLPISVQVLNKALKVFVK